MLLILIKQYIILLLCRYQNDVMDNEDSDSDHSSIQEPDIDKRALEAILEDWKQLFHLFYSHFLCRI